jgi:CRISPR type III-A/MTUBE-associated protein Csm6
MKYVLFSTLGMTDPMKNDYDGPLLHIMRHYQPCKVYLFMTKRVCELADQDNRYRIHIEYLCQHLGFSCEIVELRYEEIAQPQQFDIFYPLFEKELTRIHQSNPGCRILVNLSSGTPQMKSSCHLIALTIGFPIIPIQVSTPNEKENYGAPVFDVDAHWNNNLDNHPELEIKNRCTEVQSDNLRYLFLREAAISHINSYEYSAALMVLKGVKEFVPPAAINLLQAARHRKNMELKQAEKQARLAGYDLLPIKSSVHVKELFEYLLILKLQQQSGDLMNFIRGVSPALSRLFECFLEEKCRRKVKAQYCYKTGKNRDMWKVSREKLAKEQDLLAHYDKAFKSFFQDSYLSCATLLPMITYDCRPDGRYPDEVIIDRATKMRCVEEKIRNMAAHNIVAVTEKQFIEEAEVSSKKFLGYMLWLFKYIYPQYLPAGVDRWESYNEMNEEIIARLR